MIIRAMTEAEQDSVADLWHRAGQVAYPYLPAWRTMTAELARQVFREHIATHCRIYVVEREAVIAGYLALNGSYLDRLYIDPRNQRQGLGSALLEHARQLSPQGLELHTHQQNTAARRFYEGHGFRAVRFGVSPPPENAPDVEYHWRP